MKGSPFTLENCKKGRNLDMEYLSAITIDFKDFLETIKKSLAMNSLSMVTIEANFLITKDRVLANIYGLMARATLANGKMV